jgi:ketosteroid isomerase-like protein
MTQSRSRLIRPLALMLTVSALLAACASGPPRQSVAQSASSSAAQPATAAASAQIAAADEQVTTTERAFAKTMADRDFKAFLTFLSPEAIFFSGTTVERGPAEIATVWSPFFNGSRAPFSWRPDHVEVTSDGKLALSTGPVLQEGRVVGRFSSVWRLESPNTWRIVFDKGEAVCGPGAASGT